VAKVRVGLDIGSTAVRAAEMAIGSELPTVLRAAQVALPPGAVELGEVRQPEMVTEALKELWSRGGFKSREVLLGAGNQRIVVREVTLPFLPEKELRASLGFQVQEFIPMPVDEAVLDYDPIAEFDQDGRQMIQILLVAAQRAMVDLIVQAAAAARLEPVGLDLIPFALVRAVGSGDAGMDLESTGDEAVIDIGAHVTNICVHARQVVRFVRILPSGGRDITLAIARGLGIEDEEAEKLKRGEEVQGLDVAEAKRLAISRAAGFVDEIRSSLEFYTAQAQAARVGRVLITGGGSKLDGLLELLRERIPVSVERGQVFLRVKSQLDLQPEALAEAEPVLAAAVGLGIPGRGA
jgi:type IV pilus assembly protein PilM